MKKGSHEIDGDRLFVNVVEYTTTTAEERFWEKAQTISGSSSYASRDRTD